MAVDYAALADQARNPKTVDYGALAEQARGKKEKESESADYGPLGSYYYGLGTSLAGIPGETEKFIERTIPETLVKGGQFLGLVPETYKVPEEKPYETAFPTTSEVQETLEKMGLKRPSKGLAESLGEVAPAIFGLGKAGAETASSLKNYLSSKKSAKELMEALRTQLGGLTKEQVTGAETAGKASQTELERQQKIQEQLAAREQVAGERSRTATTAVPGQLATEANVRQEVANRAKVASAKAMRDAQAAGLNAQDAKIAADDAGRKVLMAQSAIDDLEAAMAKRPGMSKDEFGEVIRTITKKLHADAMQNRANQSGLGQVIANGDRVRNVSTKGINDYIDTVLRSTKDPNLRTALATLKRELRSEVEQNAIQQVVRQSRGGVAPAIRARRDWTNIIDAEHPEAATRAPHVIKFQTIANELSEKLGLRITPRVNIANTRRNMYGMATGDGHIFIRADLPEDEALTTFFHEFGHQIDFQLLKQAPKEVQAAVLDAWKRHKKEFSGKKTVLELRPVSGQKYSVEQSSKIPRGGYFYNQLEWFAEQASRWMTTKEEPITVVDKFFKNVADTWKKFYQMVTGHTPLTNEVKAFMESNWRNDLTGEALAQAAEPEQNAEFFLTLKQAQSLKTYIDDIVNSREFGKSGKESAIKYQFGKIKAQLLEKMKDNNQAFVDALAKWRSLSRPLDIVERNGALRPVIARDPVSLEYRLSEAEVAGKVIAKANAGHPVFTRLLAEDPSIRESARLYYVQELFGGDTAPTQRTLDLFLRNNERSLTQLGIKDEFASLSQARKTAQAAVDEATEEKASAEAASRVAARTATAAESKAAEARSLAKRAESRLAESLKTATSAEDLAKASAARTKSIELKTKNTIEKLQKAVSESVDTKRKYEKMVADLEASPVEKADAEAKKIINDLYENKIIDIDQYKSFNKELADIQDKFGKSDRAKALVRAALRKIGLYSGLGIAGSLGYFGTELAIGQ